MSAAYSRTDNGAYMPSRAKIASECKRIQSRWSEAERLKRLAGNRNDSPVMPLIVSVSPEIAAGFNSGRSIESEPVRVL